MDIIDRIGRYLNEVRKQRSGLDKINKDAPEPETYKFMKDHNYKYEGMWGPGEGGNKIVTHKYTREDDKGEHKVSIHKYADAPEGSVEWEYYGPDDNLAETGKRLKGLQSKLGQIHKNDTSSGPYKNRGYLPTKKG